MELTRTIDNETEEITFPIKRWGKFSNPTLAFMLTQGFIEVIPIPPTDAELAAAKLARLELEITTLANKKVDGHIDPVEKAHWIGVSAAYARQHSLWGSDQLNDIPDPVTYPPLTTEEHQVWFSLSLIQLNTSPIRGAARAIIASLYTMTSEEINALPADWVATHILWP